MDDLAQQSDEIEALAAIYGKDWQPEDIENRAYSVEIPDGDNYVKLHLKLPVDYPSCAPPFYEISAPHLDHSAKRHLGSLLDEVYLSFPGETLIYQWTERIREELQLRITPDQLEVNEKTEQETEKDTEISVEISKKTKSNVVEDCPTIYHGEVILDRKSNFQGHAAKVSSVDQVRQVLNALLSIRKIKHATHNIYAYRILEKNGKMIIQDFEDDGESHAGGRLMHLLEKVDAKNVLVVVSRWYGGIHLGSDRFHHISNAARQVLQDSQLISIHREQNK